jgi:primosomal protein N' (replication factor Y)
MNSIIKDNIVYYQVGVFRDLDVLYTYSFQEELPIGQLVIINFRNKEIPGIVVSQDNNIDFNGRIKKISSILPYQIKEEYIKFAQFVGNYNLIKLGNILKMLSPFSIDLILSAEKDIKGIHSKKLINIKLNREQEKAVEVIDKYKDKFKVFLLHGITGSGKTEVFLEIAREQLSNGKQVLVLVPEISLSNELAKNTAERCDADVFIWHNSVTPQRKLAIWKKALNGDKMVVVGARSALLIPFKNLGFIAIDEEHDGSFKQNECPIYHARDMTIYLGKCLNIPVVLSSATPSIESYNNAVSGKYEYLRLTSRYYENAVLPSIYIDDLRKKRSKGTLSEYSINEIKECLSQKKQVLIFVNRRGHTPKVLCKSCGWKATCPGCSSWLCYHSQTNELICHYCDFRTPAVLKCEECNESNLVGIGTGIEKVYSECADLFHDAKIEILSSDTINTPNKITKAMDRIKNHEVDLILGTQIVAKGHNFNKLNLVVVTCIDEMLYGDDFRSIEKTFQMMTQVSGRAGRIGDLKSKVIIQTYNPDDQIMRMLENNDLETLYRNEMANRDRMKMPPFGKMASIVISALSEDEASNCAKALVKSSHKHRDIKVLGPIQPQIHKIRSRYRFRILVIGSIPVQNYIRNWLEASEIINQSRVLVDIDPVDFM